MLLTHLLKMVSKRSREDSGSLWLRLPDSRVSVCLYPVLALQLTVQVWNLELSRLSKLGGWVGGRGAGLNRDVFFFAPTRLCHSIGPLLMFLWGLTGFVPRHKSRKADNTV